MKKILNALSIFVAVYCLTSCSQQEPNYGEYWKTWGDEQLKNWEYNTEMYHTQVGTYCRDNLSKNTIQSSWQAVAEQWAQMNGFPYHGITDFNLSFELYFWPDKRNMTEARLSQRVASGDLTKEELHSATAAEKGLLALEWLTFSTAMAPVEICPILMTVSAHYLGNVKKIAEYHIDNPLVDTAWLEDRDSPEAESIALNLLFQQVSQVSNRLRTSINTEGDIAPILSEGWRSKMTTKLYAKSLASIISHLQALVLRADISVNSVGLVEQQISQLTQIHQSMDNPNQFQQWTELQQAIIDTEQLIEGSIAQDMGILIGFNNYDGD